MSLLTAAERADLAAEFTAELIDACYVVRTPQVDDNEGGHTAGTPVRTGPVACAYGPLTTTEGLRGGVQIAAEATAQVALPAGTDVLDTDQIEVHIDGGNATVLTVEVVQVARTGQETWRICQVKDLRPT